MIIIVFIICFSNHDCQKASYYHVGSGKIPGVRRGILESHCGSLEMTLTRIREDVGSIPGPTQWIKILC